MKNKNKNTRTDIPRNHWQIK